LFLSDVESRNGIPLPPLYFLPPPTSHRCCFADEFLILWRCLCFFSVAFSSPALFVCERASGLSAIVFYFCLFRFVIVVQSNPMPGPTWFRSLFSLSLRSTRPFEPWPWFPFFPCLLVAPLRFRKLFFFFKTRRPCLPGESAFYRQKSHPLFRYLFCNRLSEPIRIFLPSFLPLDGFAFFGVFSFLVVLFVHVPFFPIWPVSC